MTAPHSPTIGRRRLRFALRRAREAAGLTQEQVAEAMDWSPSKIIRIEAGTVSISTNDVKALLHHYELHDPQQVAELVDLARASRRRTWWTAYRDRLPPAYFAYVGLEAEAVAMSFFRPIGIPGLLQSQGYARAFTGSAAVSHLDPALADERVELRIRRQREVLDRPQPPALDVVLDEANLHRRIGGATVLREQLEHLVRLAHRPNVTIRVLPFTVEEYTSYGPFVILEFAAGEDGDVVYVEGADTQQLIDQPGLVGPYQESFRRLRQLALGPDESRTLLEKRVQELAAEG